MNPQEKQLEYPFADLLPAPGETMQVAPGVYWLRMPLPFALDHINLWLLRDHFKGREGWTVIDCGIDKPQVRELWQGIFKNSLQGLPILRVVVTHMHPDHVGLAHWLCAHWQAPLYMSMADYAVARLGAASTHQSAPIATGVPKATPDTAGAGGGPAGLAAGNTYTSSVSDSRGDGSPAGESAARHYASHGLVDPDAQAQIRNRGNYYGSMVPDVPRQFHRLLHGASLSIGGHSWQLITGYGHAPEHISLWSADLGVLISGDMVLPRISTNVSVFDNEPEANPLPLYLDSLHEYSHLPADALVLPSHGRPFRGLHERIAQQHAHHAERLAEVAHACQQPCSAHDLLPVLFRRKLDSHQLGFAMGEAIAHLHALYFQGKLQRTMGADGIYRFQSIA